MHDEFGSGPIVHVGDGGERHALALVVSDIKQTKVLRARAILAFGFDIELPLPAKAVEEINEKAAHERLHGARYLGK